MLPKVIGVNPIRVLVTGGSGFLGKGLLAHLSGFSGVTLVAPLRNIDIELPHGIIKKACDSLGANTDWQDSLTFVDVVVHSAARVHVMHETETYPLKLFREINVEGTLNLARQAASAGVKRFVFISSIKVNGESTNGAVKFTADDAAAPIDDYGISKYEAELGLLELARSSKMEVVIIRSPLIYGPGVKANFLNMLIWLNRGVILPFGNVKNSRSLVSIDNAVDFITTCMTHPKARNEVFLVSDGEDVSTTNLLRKASALMGRTARLFPVPVWLMNTAASLLGRHAVAQRLFGSLEIDIAKNSELLDWTPSYSLDQGLEKTINHFLRQNAP